MHGLDEDRIRAIAEELHELPPADASAKVLLFKSPKLEEVDANEYREAVYLAGTPAGLVQFAASLLDASVTEPYTPGPRPNIATIPLCLDGLLSTAETEVVISEFGRIEPTAREFAAHEESLLDKAMPYGCLLLALLFIYFAVLGFIASVRSAGGG